ncbi:hypothetical protein [Flavobacterium sp.]|uniref:hypothetical protein n=1 Tax=Flavobacterium sp. TaxID=239 RepID=UPI00120301D2|nr:hypothetical protein [Flavobacterium sp.]RZJ71077.1 MAG: hypothetical protein EOO49_11530 [Flavobacterium sp.]
MKTLTFFSLIASALYSIPAGPQILESTKSSPAEITVRVVDTVLLKIDERKMERNRLKAQYKKTFNRALEIIDSTKNANP